MKSPRVPGCVGPNVYPAVPEGGWGWAVALTFFMVEVNTYGVIKSLGVFLDDLKEEFKESTSRVSWVISISVFIFAFTAPLGSLLSNRFGHRPVVMMGGFLMSLGMISSAFTNSINEMYITIGIISAVALANLSHLKQPEPFDTGVTCQLYPLTHPPLAMQCCGPVAVMSPLSFSPVFRVWLLPLLPPHRHHPRPVLL